MRLFGKLSELTRILFRQNGQEITLDSNAGTTYTADRTVQLPPGDSDQVLASATSTQTFSNKTIDGDDNTISGLALSSLKTALPDADKVIRRDASGIVVSGNAIPNTSALVTTDATQTLTGKTIDGDTNTIQDLALSSLKTVLADADKILQRDATGAVISGPAIPSGTGDIVTLNGTQTLTSKTLTSPVINSPTGIVKADVGLGNVDNTSDATKNAAAAALTNKTIDGDLNTITDLALTSLKTDLANASKVLARDASGIVTSANAVPNASALVTTDSASALTAKDIDGGTASNTSRITIPKASTATLNALTRKQATLVYDTDVNKLKFDDGSTLNLVGSGSGGGSINYIANPDAEENTLGWATYADAAQATPVDGTGGSPNVTFTRSTSSPLRGTASFLFTKDAANRQGQGASYAFTIASADTSKTLQISFDFENTGASYAAGDLTAYIYDVSNSTLLTPAAVSIAAAKFQFQTTFVASTSTSYRLILHVASTNASAYTAKVDNVIVGPQLLTLGTPTTDWISYTPTGTLTTNATYTGRYRRDGSTLFGQATATFSGATDAATVFRVTIPSGLTIDTTALSVASPTFENTVFGQGYMADSGVNRHPLNTVYFSTTQVQGIAIGTAATYADGPVVTSAVPAAISAGDTITLNFQVPIAQWAGSGVYLSTAQPEYASNSGTWDADNSTSFAYGPRGAAMSGALTTSRTKRVRFLTPIQTTDRLSLQFSDDGVFFFEVGQGLLNSAFVFQNLNAAGAALCGAGVWKVTGSSTDVDVFFAQFQWGANDDSPTGNWPSTGFWRVVKIPGQVQVATPVLPAPTAMSDVIATQQGHKEYLHGVTYNGGIAPTVTASSGGTSVIRGSFTPYQMQDGSWRLKFNLYSTFTTAASLTIGINGVTFKNIVSYAQSVTCSTSSSTIYALYAATQPNTGNIEIQFSATRNQCGLSGDVELDSKPTWAY